MEATRESNGGYLEDHVGSVEAVETRGGLEGLLYSTVQYSTVQYSTYIQQCGVSAIALLQHTPCMPSYEGRSGGVQGAFRGCSGTLSPSSSFILLSFFLRALGRFAFASACSN